MKKWILHILLVGVLGILAASCSQEADDPTVDSRGEKEKVLIRFTIALDEPKAASRTSWDGYDPDDSNYSDGPQAEDDTEYMEIGSVAENYIDRNTVQVLIYDMNGTPMGELKEVKVERDTDDDNNNQHLYYLTGAFEADADQISSLDFKLMVFANTPKKSDLNNPDTWQFAYPLLADGAGIPMWGIATFTDVDLSESTSEDNAAKLQEPIYMLRSMAKIEVTLNSEANGGYELSGVTLNKAMENGLVMPKLRTGAPADVTIKELESTEALGVEEVFNPSDGDVGEASFTGSENTYYIYVPEYDASSDNGNLEINLALTNGTKDETGNDVITNKSFTHGGYSGGVYSNTPWNVVRNHYYKYTVSVQNGVDLVVIITINPWNYRDVTYPNTPLT